MHKKLLFLFVMLCTQLSIGQTYPHVYSGGTAGTASANPNFTLTDFSTCQTSASLDANGYNWAGWSGPNYAIEINGVTIASGQYGPQTIDLTPYIPVTSVKLRSSSGSSLWLNIDATVTINSPLATMPANGPTVSDANICDTAFPYTVMAGLNSGGVILKWYTAEQGGSPIFTAPVVNSVGTHIYWVSQADAAGCESRRMQITINATGAPTGTATQSFCDPTTKTLADLIVTGTALKWYADASTLIQLPTTTSLVNGITYYVSQTVSGCETTRSAITVGQFPTITQTPSQADVLCFGAATGSATVVASGGLAPYSYLWSDGQTAATATGLAAGDYDVTITDANSCTLQHSFTITEPASPLSITPNTNHVDVLCFGDATGSATVAVTGGTGAYTYLWSNGQTAATATGLAAGDYDVTITDANNCTLQHSFTIAEPAAPLSITPNTNHVDVLCFGDATGSATVAVTGGTGAYTYLWNNGQTTDTISELPAGDYDVTITDDNGCQITENFTITEPLAPLTQTSSQVDVLCFGDDTGTATVTVTDGTAPYTYLWNDGQTAATATGLVAGDYDVTITDDNGCQLVANFTINEPLTGLTQTASQVDVLCFGSATGSATVDVTGGTAPYTYLWNDGQTAAMATGLAAGDYDVTITDDNGCTLQHLFTIAEPTAPLSLTPNTTQVDVLCFGDASGSATVAVTGGTAPYTYLWNDGQTTQTITELVAGTYDVTITDDNGCILQHSFTIAEPGTPLTSSATHIDVLCYNALTGEATITATGGTGAYTYNWNSAPIQTTATATGLHAGTYIATVTDANGCTSSQTVVITQPTAAVQINAAKTNVTCSGNADGTITLTVSGGTGAYTYNWTPSVSTTNAATGLAPGNYVIAATDANGCTATITVNVTQPPVLTGSINVTNSDCAGFNNGTATVTVTGGTLPYTYAWSNGATTATAYGLNPGTYTVVVTDAHNCSFTGTVTSTEPPLITITAQPVDYTATVDGTAIFSVTAVNGWAYMWHVSKDNGTTWELVENGGFNPHYIGAQTNTLVISEITPAHNGYLYRARVFQIGTCLVYSDPAELNAEEVLGTEHFDNLHMTIYPNPASTEVYVTIPEFSSNKNVRFTMFDLNGRMVRDLNIETETSKFDVSGLESGVYIMNISSDKGSVVKKLVVDKKF